MKRNHFDNSLSNWRESERPLREDKHGRWFYDALQLNIERNTELKAVRIIGGRNGQI